MSQELPIDPLRSALVGMARMIEQREDPTGQHIDRVMALCLRLANAVAAGPHADLVAAVTPEFLSHLADAAALHDIGKACIPDAVLLKPSHLSQAEFDLIRQHPIHGATVFEPSPSASFGRLAYDVIRHHHEKWDGTGYPDGLAGEAIPLAARIVAIADAFDALTTWRCYKPASSPERAYKVIQDAAGKHFDPRLVAIFGNEGG